MFDPQIFRFDENLVPEEYILEIISLVAASMNITTCQYKITTFEHSQNYFGVLVPAVLTEKNGEVEKVYSLVLKLAPLDESYRVSGALTVMFKAELYAYSILLREYQNLQQSFKLSQPLIVPEYYYGREEYCKEVLVLRNMIEDGYKPYLSNMFLEKEHIIASVKALATFHALSFILRKSNKELFDEAAQVFSPINRDKNSRFMEVLIDRLFKSTHRLQNTQYTSLLMRLSKDCIERVEDTYTAVQGVAFCHADMWKENLLFKYDDKNQPTDVCIVDFQNVRMSSPAFDVLYLITSSTTSELRSLFYFEFLDIYYENFEKTLKEAGIEANNVYSKAAFKEDLKTVAPACFIIANTALWLSCGLQQDGHVRSKKVFSSSDEKHQALELFTSLVKGIIDDYCQYGYLKLCDCSSVFQSPYI